MTGPEQPVRDECDISVVIAVLNGAAILPTQLAALEQQDFEGTWEVLICDNGSTDDLERVVGLWSRRLPGLRLVDASGEPGAGYAKRAGIEAAKSDLVALCDADDLVCPGWLGEVYRGLQTHALVTGPLAHVAFNDVVEHRVDTCFRTARFTTQPGHRHGVPYAAGGNCGLRRADLPAGFAADYLVGSDGGTSWRALRSGHSVGWVPAAKLLVRERPSGRKSARRLISAGVACMKQDREFADLFSRRPTFPFRPIGWCLLHAVGAVIGRNRTAWSGVFFRTLGRVIEFALPGWWFSAERRRIARGGRACGVASVSQTSQAHVTDG